MLTYILLGCILVLLAALTGSLVVLGKRKKREKALLDAVAQCLQDGGQLPYSLHDDRFAILENEIADLSARLAQEQNNARALVRENHAFIADVSHQLKTPLAGLRLYCEMAQNADKEESIIYTQKQLLLLDHTDALVSNLLRLEKLRSEAYEMEIKPEKLQDICRTVCNDLHFLFPQKSFIINGEAVLHCDSQWIAQAIENIVKNACEHTEANGKIEIEISKGEHCVFATVQDDGGGLPEHERSRLFERFYRSPSSATNGSGLGLAITKEIVERHHGSISAENKKGGLCFTLCLPVAHGITKVRT